MAPKKSRTEGPPPLSNRDHMERANFAVQASMFLQQLGSSSGSSSTFPPPIVDRKGKGRAVEVEADTGSESADFSRIARNEMRALKKWSVHNQVKIDPSLKRTLCPCNTILVPGLTARVRRRHNKIYHTCMVCGVGRSLPLYARGDVDELVPHKRRRGGKVPFHERERPVLEEDKGKGKKSDLGSRSGHVLWRGDERCSGWGVLQRPEERAVEMPVEDRGSQPAPPGRSASAVLSAEELEELEACG